MPAASAALASGMSITGLGIHSGVGRARSFALASAICSSSALLGMPALDEPAPWLPTCGEPVSAGRTHRPGGLPAGLSAAARL